VAVLLTGQLRTAEFTVPFMEELVVRASAPSPVHVFAHVWALRQKDNTAGAKYLKHAGPAVSDQADEAAVDSAAASEKAKVLAAKAIAGARAEARLRRMEGLAEMVVEDEEDFERVSG